MRNFISWNKTDYDTIIYLEYDGDIRHTFCDDIQLQISTVSRQDHEPLGEYFVRKFDFFRRICFGKRVLFVLDNFSGKITKDLSSIINCGYDTIIVTRNQPPKNSFVHIEIGAIDNTADILHLIAQNLGRPLTNEERICFEEIIALVQRHTLAIELITRQIGAGKLSIQTALDLIRENGFSRFFENKIGNYKDGEEVYDTLSVIISALFDATSMSMDERLALKLLALLDVRGLETSLVYKFFPDISMDLLTGLFDKGWLYNDNRIRLHSVIAETVQN